MQETLVREVIAPALIGSWSHLKVSNTLHAQLLDLGIHPFKDESVKEYKRQKLEEINAQAAKYGLYDFFLPLVCTLGGIIFSLASSLDFLPESYFGNSVLAILIGILGLVFGHWYRNEILSYQWQNKEQHELKVPIPLIIKLRADLIRKQIPGSSILFEELGPDPFMKVIYGAQVKYVDCWDEKGFIP